jgi:hypothetical protein
MGKSDSSDDDNDDKSNDEWWWDEQQRGGVLSFCCSVFDFVWHVFCRLYLCFIATIEESYIDYHCITILVFHYLEDFPQPHWKLLLTAE